jgi:hypothetical protein
MFAILSSQARSVSGDWRGGLAVSLMGSLSIDLANASPRPGARLWIFCLMGTVGVRLPAGARSSVGGLSLLGSFGGRHDAGEQPDLRVTCVNVMGSVGVGG